MYITVRMQMPYDIDLLGLYQNKGFDLSKAIKGALISWARNIPYQIETPAYEEPGQLKLKWFHFTLNDREHADVIEKWQKIRSRERNTFLKMLFRFYLTSPYIPIFQNDPGAESLPAPIKTGLTTEPVVSTPVTPKPAEADAPKMDELKPVEPKTVEPPKLKLVDKPEITKEPPQQAELPQAVGSTFIQEEEEDYAASFFGAFGDSIVKGGR